MTHHFIVKCLKEFSRRGQNLISWVSSADKFLCPRSNVNRVGHPSFQSSTSSQQPEPTPTSALLKPIISHFWFSQAIGPIEALRILVFLTYLVVETISDAGGALANIFSRVKISRKALKDGSITGFPDNEKPGFQYQCFKS
jgi:hypothetical protein